MDDTKIKTFTPPDGGYGWIIVLATTLLNISVLPLVQCFGIIYRNDFASLGITAAETSFLLHLHSAIYCSLGLLGSPLLKKFDFRRVALFGTSLMCAGILLSSFAKSYAMLLCTFSIVFGCGQGIMLPATYLATNTYFKQRLTLAVSFSVTGASISYIIMPQVCNKLMEHFKSTQSTVLVLAAISLAGIACCLMLRPVEIQRTEVVKEEIELINTEGDVYKATTLPLKPEGIYAKVYQLFNLELLNDRPYVVAVLGMSISFASELNIIVMVAFILPELASFERHEVALALSIQSIADIIGRLGIPLVGHCFSISPKVMYACSLITATVGRTAMAAFYASKVMIFVCVSVIGLAKGMKAVYQSVIIPKHVSLEKLPAANGLNMLLTGFLSLLLGPIIGFIHDVTKSYVYALHTSSILSMSCVVLWAIYYNMRSRHEAEETED